MHGSRFRAASDLQFASSFANKLPSVTCHWTPLRLSGTLPPPPPAPAWWRQTCQAVDWTEDLLCLVFAWVVHGRHDKPWHPQMFGIFSVIHRNGIFSLGNLDVWTQCTSSLCIYLLFLACWAQDEKAGGVHFLSLSFASHFDAVSLRLQLVALELFWRYGRHVTEWHFMFLYLVPLMLVLWCYLHSNNQKMEVDVLKSEPTEFAVFIKQSYT